MKASLTAFSIQLLLPFLFLNTSVISFQAFLPSRNTMYSQAISKSPLMLPERGTTAQEQQQQEDTRTTDEELAEIEDQLTESGYVGQCEEHLLVRKVYKAKLESLRDHFPSADTLNSRKELFKPIPIMPPKGFENVTDGEGRVHHSKSHDEDLENTKEKSSPEASTTDTAPNPSHLISFDYHEYFTDDDVAYLDAVRSKRMVPLSRAFVRAGPRERLHFNPSTVNAAIVTCGGLCPGLNNVIRELTHSLYSNYGVPAVYGIRGGFRGFYDWPDFAPVLLTNELVEDIHHDGGTVLRSGRGGYDGDKIVDFLKQKNISQLYIIGGDGTHRAAFLVHKECRKHNMNVAVVGIPKTIDNDVDYIDRSFGFLSSVEAAQASIRTAKTESMCVSPRGITVVKLMGRSAGYLAAYAALGSGDVDCVLIPEVPIVLEGREGILPFLEKRLEEKKYAVVVVAEGAGEELLGSSSETDKGGNKRLQPIGEFIQERIRDHFNNLGLECTVRYIDPSYMVRTVPANAADSIYCTELAHNAVHGAMAGYTGVSVGQVNSHGVYIPIPLLVATSPRVMDSNGLLWERILSLTGQPHPIFSETCDPENDMECLPLPEKFIH